MADDRIQKAEAGLLSAIDQGDTDAVELFKKELATLRGGPVAGVGNSGAQGGTASGTGPALSQEQARGKFGEALKRGATEVVTKTIPQVGAEVVKGLTGFAMLPGELVRSFANKMGGDPADFGHATDMIHEGIDSVVPPPDTKAGRRGVEIAGGGVSGLISPGSRARNLVTGLMSATGGVIGREAEKNIAPDNSGVIGGILGTVAGGTPNSIFKGRGSYQQMLAEALKGTTPADFNTARRLQQEAQSVGMQLTPEQLFSNQSGLDELVHEVLRSGGGKGKLQNVVQGQPGKALEIARGQGAAFGENPGNSAAIRDLRLAAEGAIDDVRLTPSQKALFDEKGAMLSAPQIQSADAKLGAAIKDLQASEARKPLQDFRELLRKIAEYRMEPGKPVGPLVAGRTGEFRELPKTGHLVKEGGQSFTAALSPEQKKLDSMKASDLDTMIKEALLKLDDLKLSTPGLAKRQQGQISGVLTEIRSILDDITPTRQLGRGFEATRHDLRDSLTAGLTGRIAGRHGVTESMPDAVGTLRSTLGSNVAQDKDIAQLAAALRNRSATVGNPEQAAQATRALPQAARVLWDEAVDKTFTNVQGRTPSTAGSQLYTTLLGSPGSAKEKNFDQLVQGVAGAYGLDPKALQTGFKTTLRVLDASGRNRSGLGFAAGDIKDAAGQSGLRDAARAAGPLSRPQMIVEKLYLAGKEKQYRKLSDVFTNPEALRILEEIGSTPMVSSRSGSLMQVLFQTLQQPGRASAEETPNGP